MGNVIVGDNGTGYYSERTNELIFLDVRAPLSMHLPQLARPRMNLRD